MYDLHYQTLHYKNRNIQYMELSRYQNLDNLL